MGYKLLGFVVWQGGKWYVRKRWPVLSSRRFLTAVVVVAGVAGLAAARRGEGA
jgi:hypothetical protein